MKYCKACLYPDTKPDIVFDDKGICSACNAFENRKLVDWKQRHEEFVGLVKYFKSKRTGNYDCIIPVSGGKDSYFQTKIALEHGLRPLLVTAATDSMSDIGRRNLDNLHTLGCDAIEVKPNHCVRHRVMRYALETVGDVSWAEHVLIFTIPVKVALQLDIKLILWGENPQNEYGGPIHAQDHSILTSRWLPEFGGLNGLRPMDLAETNIISDTALSMYLYPSMDEVEKAKITGLFTGMFFNWDGYANAAIAESMGFEPYIEGVEGSGYDYENLDNYFTGIHDYFKYLKFGFGRATDIANNHIRRGRLSRQDGIVHVQTYDGEYPSTYLGKPLQDILEEIDMDIPEFLAITKRFANKELFDVSAVSERTPRPLPKFRVS